MSVGGITACSVAIGKSFFFFFFAEKIIKRQRFR